MNGARKEATAERSKTLLNVLSSANSSEFEFRSQQIKLFEKITDQAQKMFAIKHKHGKYQNTYRNKNKNKMIIT